MLRPILAPRLTYAWLLGAIAIAAPAPAQEPPPPAAPPAEAPAAEAPPAQAPTAETPPAAPVAPAVRRPIRSLFELGRRDVADQLELTPEQRDRIGEILEARARALEEAAPETHAEIERSIEAQLAEVLTDQQLARWVAMTEPAAAPEETAPPGERKLRFSFRFQPWSDVLTWFAEQSDLSLVLDAPPPGTFNYTDSRLYSPAEAIDLLNGVLMTKGYTLIRRERMLMLLKLDKELPADLIPIVEFKDLDSRGKFELVTVRFPLGKRDAAAVAAEIAPLLGPHGKSSALPQTRQLVVTETAGKMQAISAVIESIPDPDEAKPPKAEEGESVLAVYPLGGADGAAAVKALEALFAGSRFVHDPKTEQIIAFAPPAIQVGVKDTLAQMQADEPVEKQFRLEVYPIDAGERPADILAMFKSLVPEAKIALDPTSEHLTVWATTPQHETIKKTLEGIATGTTNPSARSLQVYRLQRSDPATTLAVLQKLLPRAKLAVEAKTSSIVALADETDHETIRRTLDELEAAPAPEDQPAFTTYPVTTDQRKRVVAALAGMTAELPGIQVLNAAGAGTELTVRARPAQHELIKAIVEQLAEDVPAELQPRLVAYPLQFVEPGPVTTALASLVPDAKVTVESRTNQLLVWATPADHEKVQSTIKELDLDLPPGLRLQLHAHPLGQADPTAVSQVLALVAPQAKLISNATNGSLIVLARGDQQDVIRETIASMQPSIDDPNRAKIEIYPLRNADPATMAAALGTAFPKARITADTIGKRLVVFATPPEHITLKEAIETLQEPTGGALALKVASYPVGAADLVSTVTLLQGAFADARFVADTKSNAVLVWGSEDVHAKVGEMIGTLAADVPEESKKSTKSYKLERADANAALAVLRGLIPAAYMAVDARTGSVLVTATGLEHAQAAAAIAELDVSTEGIAGPEVKVYPIKATDPSTLVVALQYMYAARPDVRISLDLKSQKAVVWAPAAEHENIAKAIAEIDTNADNQQTLVVYHLDGADSTSAITLLQSAMVDARFVPDLKTDTILAWARGEQHPRIKELVAQLAREVPADKQRTTRIYRLQNSDATAALTVLQPVVPTARMAVDPRSGQLAISATGQEHEELQAAIAEFDKQAPDENPAEVRVYTLNDGDPASALAALQQMFATNRDVRVSMDAKSKKIIAWARSWDHDTIRRTLEEIDLPRDIAESRQVEVYALGDSDGESIRALITGLLGGSSDVRIVSDPRNAQLVVLARPTEHATIRAMLDQMKSEAATVEVMPLRVVDAFSASLAIENLYEGRGGDSRRAPKVEADPDGQQLLVRGTPAQVKEIRQMLVKMGETFLAEGTGAGGKIRVIPLPGGVSRETLEELQKAWSQMGRNPIRVVTPSALAPTLEESRQPAAAPEPEKTAPAEPASMPETPADPSSAASENMPDGSSCQPPAEAAPPEAPAEQPAPEPAAPQPPTDEPPPVIITIGDDSITIASDDLEALDQIEGLLRNLAQRQPAGGKDFTVFTLKYASASEVAESLEALFMQGLFSFRSNNVTIVPDQRLNALIVQGSPSELATIENLLKILDTNELPESANAQRPRIIPIRQGDAGDVAFVLREVFRPQLIPRPPRQSTGGRSRGNDPEFAAYMQYLNGRAAATPEMTLSVDTTTNSLVVLAPETLFREVERLVKELDTAALSTDRTIKVVQLKSAKGTIVQEVLEDLLRDRARSRRQRNSAGGGFSGGGYGGGDID